MLRASAMRDSLLSEQDTCSTAPAPGVDTRESEHQRSEHHHMPLRTSDVELDQDLGCTGINMV
jgi:hypothetical protein